jgi:hypothetical protein
MYCAAGGNDSAASRTMPHDTKAPRTSSPAEISLPVDRAQDQSVSPGGSDIQDLTSQQKTACPTRMSKTACAGFLFIAASLRD